MSKGSRYGAFLRGGPWLLPPPLLVDFRGGCFLGGVGRLAVEDADEAAEGFGALARFVGCPWLLPALGLGIDFRF